MTRREMLSLVGCGACSAALTRGQSAQSLEPPADITLRIQEVSLELAPGHTIKTIGYNGQVPGPLLRMTEGKSVTVSVLNETNDDEMVHWHGLHIPSDVDGSHDEGTPNIPRHGMRRYTFTPRPAGTRWYHSHVMSGRNLHTGTYSGQFGMLLVEGSYDPGRYDQDVPIILHEWEPSFAKEGPLDIEYRFGSVNGKMLGAGEPIRVKHAQRVLFRILNASATQTHRLALPGHRFEILALDGNPLAEIGSAPVIDIAPGERVDAIVQMHNPGVWILGDVDNRQRSQGMGIVVEYGNQTGPAKWGPPQPVPWDYTIFGRKETAGEPDGRIPLVFKEAEGGHHFTINGKAYPHTDPILVEPNKRYRMIFDNQSADAHPVHLHRHTFELTRYADISTSGVLKDVVVVPAWKKVEVDFTANNPGPTLFHCHQQFHMDNGFMAMIQYSDSSSK